MDYLKFRARKSQTTIKQNENTMTMHYILSETAEKKEKKEKILATDWTKVEYSRQTRTAKVPRDHNIPAIFHQASSCFNMARRARSWNNVSIYFDIF